MTNTKTIGWSILGLIISNSLLMTIAYPQATQQLSQYQQIQEEQNDEQSDLVPVYNPSYPNSRKFAVKPNASKKVALDDIDEDIQTNQIQDSGFSWSNMIASLLQMIFNGGGANAPTKSDDLDNNGAFAPSPWTQIISVGLKIITTLLGGGAPSDGIDKVDNGGTPMQSILAAVFSSVLGAKDPEQVNSMAKQAGEFINIVVNLLDALKTSFSHRSIAARSIGKRDSVSDAAVASISMLKGYMKTYRNTEDKCMQKYLCEANSECVSEIGGSSIFCQLGTYATSFILERSTGGKFDGFYNAGRQGRSGQDCRQIYIECNEV